MRTKRNQRGGRKARISLAQALRKAVSLHFKKHLVAYVPVVLPLFFFFLAQIFTLITLICIKSGVLGLEDLGHKTVVTWSFFGFPLLLLCSYGCFFAVARPAAVMLASRFPEWTPTMLTLAAGSAYGTAIGLALLVLLEPGSLFRVLFLLAIGLATGLGNWFFYRKLTVVDA